MLFSLLAPYKIFLSKVGGPVSESGLYSDEVDGPHGLGEDE